MRRFPLIMDQVQARMTQYLQMRLSNTLCRRSTACSPISS